MVCCASQVRFFCVRTLGALPTRACGGWKPPARRCKPAEASFPEAQRRVAIKTGQPSGAMGGAAQLPRTHVPSVLLPAPVPYTVHTNIPNNFPVAGNPFAPASCWHGAGTGTPETSASAHARVSLGNQMTRIRRHPRTEGDLAGRTLAVACERPTPCTNLPVPRKLTCLCMVHTRTTVNPYLKNTPHIKRNGDDNRAVYICARTTIDWDAQACACDCKKWAHLRPSAAVIRVSAKPGGGTFF